MKSTLFPTIRHSISAFLSYAGVAVLVLVTLMKTEAELGRQDSILLYVVFGLSLVALLNLCLGRGRVRLTIVDLLAGVLFLWLGVGYYYVAEINAATKWLQTLGLFALYFNLRVIGSYHKHIWEWALCLALFCGLTEAFIGVRQALGLAVSNHSLFRITGTFYNPGPYGGFVAVVMSMASGYLVTHYETATSLFKKGGIATRQDIMKAGMYLLCAVTFILSFVIIFSTGSRAALFSFIVCALLAVVCRKEYRVRVKAYLAARKKMAVVISVTVAIVLSAGVLGMYLIKKDSADGRLLTWSVMGKAIAENPLFGTGFGSFEGEYAVIQGDYFSDHPDSRFIPVADAPSHGFNEFLQIGMETGMAGMVLVALVLGMAFYRLYRNGSPAAYGILALAIFAVFSYPFSLIPFQILLVLCIGQGGGIPGGGKRKALSVGRGTLAVSTVVIIFLMLFILPWHHEKISATKEWKDVRYFYNMELYDDCISDYAKLYPVLSDNPRFLFEYGHSLNKAGDYIRSNSVLEHGAGISNDPMFRNIIGNNYKALGNYDDAEAHYKAAFAAVPNRLYPLYLLMKLYSEAGRDGEAADMARRIVGFTPKVESPATNQMKDEAETVLQAGSNRPYI